MDPANGDKWDAVGVGRLRDGSSFEFGGDLKRVNASIKGHFDDPAKGNPIINLSGYSIPAQRKIQKYVSTLNKGRKKYEFVGLLDQL